MFDLLGVLDLTGHDDSLLTLDVDFLDQPWIGESACVRNVVQGNRFQAVYREHVSATQSHYGDNGLHLFIVGEAFARSNSVIDYSGPLPARRIMLLYQQDQIEFLDNLKGSFTLVIVDEIRRQCSLYNSRFGISPFYYAYALDGARFIFSTSLTAIAACLSAKPELDLAAVAELALFNYPLGDRTYFRQVKMLRPAEIVRASATGLQQETWWDVRTLYDGSLYFRHQALELGSELFHKTVNDLVCDVPRVRMSFTSGFDSRAVMAVLKKEPEDYLAYSFGIPGSLNIDIPEQIARDLGLSYQPVVLDGAYEQVFDEYALRAVMLSGCLSTVERANYPYAFEKLADFSPVVITGLFGSELLRTFQNVGHIISANLVRLNLAADPCGELSQVIAAPDAAGYFAPELLRQAAEEVEADVAVVLTERFGDMTPDRRFYMFLLTEGLRKYFGAEVHMERPWATNRFPYLDDEFVEFLFRAPFAGVYSRTLKPTVGNRFHSQYFYAYIIRKYRPELLKAPTDHGHSPEDILSPFALFKIGPKYLLWRRKRERIGYREFKTEEWTEALYHRQLFTKPIRDDLFSEKLEEDFRNGAWKTHHLEFAKAASLKLWLEAIGGE